MLLAIDDLHWLDPSSAQVVAFAARRFTGPVGVAVNVTGELLLLMTESTCGPGSAPPCRHWNWIEFGATETVTALTLSVTFAVTDGWPPAKLNTTVPV